MAAKQQLEAAPHGARETSGRRGLLGRTRGRVRIDSVVPDEELLSLGGGDASHATRHCSDAIDATRHEKTRIILLVGLAEPRHDGVLPREQFLPIIQNLDLLLVEIT